MESKKKKTPPENPKCSRYWVRDFIILDDSKGSRYMYVVGTDRTDVVIADNRFFGGDIGDVVVFVVVIKIEEMKSK